MSVSELEVLLRKEKELVKEVPKGDEVYAKYAVNLLSVAYGFSMTTGKSSDEGVKEILKKIERKNPLFIMYHIFEIVMMYGYSYDEDFLRDIDVPGGVIDPNYVESIMKKVMYYVEKIHEEVKRYKHEFEKEVVKSYT